MLGALSLRSRFLIPPIIGVVITLILYLSSDNIISSHAKVFNELRETNLSQISKINLVITNLTNSNSEIISLLLESSSFDEEEVYTRGKKALNQLYQIEKQLNQSISDEDMLNIDGLEIFQQIKSSFSDYHQEAITAIEMASVDTSEAYYQLTIANNKLKDLNKLFIKLSNFYSASLTQQAEIVEGTLFKKTYITELAIFLIALMIVTAIYFSYGISKGLIQVHGALTRLSKNETDIKIHDSEIDYLKDIWNAVSEFKDTIEKSESYKNDLLLRKFAMDQHAIIATTDIKGSITYANSKFCEISGYKKEELIGKNHSILNSDNQPKEYWRNMFLTVSKGNVWHDEVLNVAKDGHKYWVYTTIVPVTASKTHKVTGYMAIRTDITTQKNQQEILVEAKIEAESAVNAKSQFLATMSHEIRTPMNGVLGMLGMLKNDELNTKQKHQVDVANDSAQSLLQLIDDILDFSKVDAGKLEIENIQFNVHDMLSGFTETMAFQADNKNLKLILDATPSTHIVAIGDPSRIRQVLTNIVGNAIKFTQQGRITIKVDLNSKDDSAWYFDCEVTDTGIGVNPDRINILFDSFSQVDASTTRKYGGTGLGLAISKKLVELMQGKIEVSSQEGNGSCFSFRVILQKNIQKNNLTTDSSILETPNPTDANTCIDETEAWPENTRLLLVEDNPINQMVAEDLLESMGLKISIAHNGLDALEQLRDANEEQPFTIILMDCLMPEMDGYEATQNIRAAQAGERYINIPIIAMTANAMVGDKEKCLKTGMSDYLSKPVDSDRLYEKLQYWLKK